MNKTLTRIFCLFMAFQVLFASTGFAMYEHFCKIKGSTIYSLSTPKKSCCSAKQQSTKNAKKSILKRTNCCSDQVSLYKISPNASQDVKIDVKTPSLTYLPTSFGIFSYTQPSDTISERSLLYANSSPPLSGRDITILVQSFLI